MTCLSAISEIPWLEVIKTLAPVATAAVAVFALKNWKRQDRAKRESEFLDALVDAVHTYVAEMSSPRTLVRFFEVRIQSHEPTTGNDNPVVKYIEANGESDSKRLLDALEAVQPSVIRLRSLAAKGQIFKFEDYAACRKSVETLGHQFDKIEALATGISFPSLNWRDPEVSKMLCSLQTIKEEDINNTLKNENAAVLNFARKAYGRIYG